MNATMVHCARVLKKDHERQGLRADVLYMNPRTHRDDFDGAATFDGMRVAPDINAPPAPWLRIVDESTLPPIPKCPNCGHIVSFCGTR